MSEDRHETNCQACGAELICLNAVPADDDEWICPRCNEISTDDIAIADDCPHCGYPCHRKHIDVKRCDNCGTLNFTSQGYFQGPKIGDGTWFFCDDCRGDW